MVGVNLTWLLVIYLTIRLFDLYRPFCYHSSAERAIEKEEELTREWLTLVQEKNIILKRESELIYL